MAQAAGFYLGADFIDMILVETSKEKLRILKTTRHILYTETPPAVQEEKMSLIAQGIKKIFESSSLKVRVINFGLPQDEIIIRRFKMPYLPVEERQNAVKFEAQKYLPFKIDDTVSDFYIAEESKDTRTMDALFVAINKQAMERYVALFRFEGARVRLNIVDIIPMALLRLLVACKKISPEKTELLIYAEKDARGTIIIIKDKNPYLVREVGLSISKDVFFENILNNLRLSIDYFKRETKEIGVNKIIICGEGHLIELQAFLKENIATTEMEIFELKDEIEGLNELPKKQMIAIGLAMASFEKPRPRINLSKELPQIAVFKAIAEYKPLIIEGVGIILALVALQLIMGLTLSCAKNNLNRIKAQRPYIKGVDNEVSLEALADTEKKFKERVEFLKNLAGENRLFLTKKLNSLGRLIPNDAWIESFEFSDMIDNKRGLLLQGMIYSKDKIETQIANKIFSDMKQSQDFSFGLEDIKMGTLKRTSAYSKEVVTFSIESAGRPLNSADLFGVSKGAPSRMAAEGY